MGPGMLSPVGLAQWLGEEESGFVLVLIAKLFNGFWPAEEGGSKSDEFCERGDLITGRDDGSWPDSN